MARTTSLVRAFAMRKARSAASRSRSGACRSVATCRAAMISGGAGDGAPAVARDCSRFCSSWTSRCSRPHAHSCTCRIVTPSGEATSWAATPVAGCRAASPTELRRLEISSRRGCKFGWISGCAGGQNTAAIEHPSATRARARSRGKRGFGTFIIWRVTPKGLRWATPPRIEVVSTWLAAHSAFAYSVTKGSKSFETSDKNVRAPSWVEQCCAVATCRSARVSR